jgi:hypothetical protein
MIYGGGGNGQRKLQEMLAQNNNNNGSWQAATTMASAPLQPHQFLETVPTAPPPPLPPPIPQNTATQLAPGGPTQMPPDLAVPKEPLRSLRIVQRERGGDFEGEAGGDNEEEVAFENGQEKQQIDRTIGGPRMPMEIQKSL